MKKTSRKILSAIMAVIMIMCTGAVSFSSFAATKDTVTVGDVTYEITDNCITKVTVKDGVSLGEYTVPKKIETIAINSIGAEAYKGTSIRELTIPESVTSIGRNAFSYCRLESVTFNSNNCIINRDFNMSPHADGKESAFYGNSSLKTFLFGENVSSIPANVCTNIASLESVVFNATNVTSVGDSAFAFCLSLKTIDMSKFTIIGNYGFKGCATLEKIELPKAVIIGENAFNGCSNAKSINIPKATSIGASAFANNISVTSVTIPESTTTIGRNAFSYCRLESVTFNSNNCIINRDCNVSPYAGGEESAFYGNSYLKTFVFGKNVSSIPANVCTNIASLESVVFNATNVTSVGDSAFAFCLSLETIDMSKCTTIGNYGFEGCTSFEKIKLPKAEIIGESAFDGCSNVKSIDIPKATSIGACAFMGTGITEITIPESVTSISGGAFRDCTSLITVYFNSSSCAMSSYTSASYAPFYSQSPVFYGNSSLATIVFGGNVTSIPARACTGVYTLETVEFKAAAEAMGENAFYGCYTPDEIKYAGTEDQWNALKAAAAKGNDKLFECKNVEFVTSPEKEYTVTFNANGGSVATANQKVKEGTEIKLQTAERTGYDFLGWSTESNATVAAYSAGSNYKVTKDVTLYAVWKENKPTESKYTDSHTGVEVVGDNAFDGKDVELKVKTTDKDEEHDVDVHDFGLTKVSVIYNISFTVNGVVTQPSKAVKVRIPYTDSANNKIKVFHYYYNEKNEFIADSIKGVVFVNGYIEFETTHFSNFVIVSDDFAIEGSDAMQFKGEQTLKTNANADVEYKSNNTSVVTVDPETGKVTAVGAGTATITATVKGTGVSATKTITVKYAWWQIVIRILLLGFIWYK